MKGFPTTRRSWSKASRTATRSSAASGTSSSSVTNSRARRAVDSSDALARLHDCQESLVKEGRHRRLDQGWTTCRYSGNVDGVPPTDLRYNNREASDWNWSEYGDETEELEPDEAAKMTAIRCKENGMTDRETAQFVPYSHGWVNHGGMTIEKREAC